MAITPSSILVAITCDEEAIATRIECCREAALPFRLPVSIGAVNHSPRATPPCHDHASPATRTGPGTATRFLGTSWP